jgi:hypothetical protein
MFYSVPPLLQSHCTRTQIKSFARNYLHMISQIIETKWRETREDDFPKSAPTVKNRLDVNYPHMTPRYFIPSRQTYLKPAGLLH